VTGFLWLYACDLNAAPIAIKYCVICVVRILPVSKTVVGGLDLVDLTVKGSIGVGR